MDRRDFIRIVSFGAAAPASVVRAALNPLRAVPAAVEALATENLIGLVEPDLRDARWSDARLLAEPAEALESMTRAAIADGLDVCARCGFRSLRQQRAIWNRKYGGEDPVHLPDGTRVSFRRNAPPAERVRAILHYVAFPGTSRHHWGTDMDIAQTFGDRCARRILDAHGGSAAGPAAGEPAPGRPEAADEASKESACLEVHEWLLARAGEFGFHLVYDANRGGFEPEPWHWSYLSFAIPVLARYLDEIVPDMLRDHDVEGEALVLDDFEGYRTRHMLGISPAAAGDGHE